MQIPDQDLINWLGGLLAAVLAWAGRLIWMTHKGQTRTEVALAEHKECVNKIISDHQNWVRENYPTKEHLDKRLEDMITPLQLSSLETKQQVGDLVKFLMSKKK